MEAYSVEYVKTMRGIPQYITRAVLDQRPDIYLPTVDDFSDLGTMLLLDGYRLSAYIVRGHDFDCDWWNDVNAVGMDMDVDCQCDERTNYHWRFTLRTDNMFDRARRDQRIQNIIQLLLGQRMCGIRDTIDDVQITTLYNELLQIKKIEFEQILAGVTNSG